MVKTRSQSSKLPIKKEDGEELKTELKHDQFLNGISNRTRTRNKITKTKNTPKTDNSSPLFVSEIKSEEECDEKALLGAEKPKLSRRITQEQVNKFIGYVENDKMSIKGASRKVNISFSVATKYHYLYKHDPEGKIPDTSKNTTKINKPCTEEQIKSLIDYIEKDKMSFFEASIKAHMSEITGRKYYSIYKDDPEGNIPKPMQPFTKAGKRCTQEQIEALIGYIVKDGMAVKAASRKANISDVTGRRYYNMYLEDPEHNIPAPATSWKNYYRYCTQEQIKEFINYVVQDKMSIKAASKKANIGVSSGQTYHKMYMDDPERRIPAPRSRVAHIMEQCTQEQIKALISYIEQDKMSIKEASRKINISYSTAYKHYKMHMDNCKGKMIQSSKSTLDPGKPCTQDKINKLIAYIVKDNLTVAEAARKVNINQSTGMKYYNMYKNDPEKKIPVPKTGSKPCTQEQIKALISHIVEDKMSVQAASKKINIGFKAAYKYYDIYKNDPEGKIPIPWNRGMGHKSSCTQEQISDFIGYIMKDKMSIRAAARKVNITSCTATKYFSRYINDPNRNIPDPKRPRQHVRVKFPDKVKKAINHIIDDKMTIKAAAAKVKMGASTISKHYKQYLKDLDSQNSVNSNESPTA